MSERLLSILRPEAQPETEAVDQPVPMREIISTQLASISQKEYITKDTLRAMSPDIQDIDLDRLHTTFNANAEKYGLTDPDKQRSFFAQVLHETGGTLGPKNENLNYSPSGLKKNFKFYRDNPQLAQAHGRYGTQKANQEAIANHAYGNRMGNTEPGEGHKYRGMGWLQLTGRDNFSKAAQSMGITSKELVDNRNDVGYQAEAAMAYWRDNNLNEAESVDAATKVINRHTNSYAERRQKYAQLMNVI